MRRLPPFWRGAVRQRRPGLKVLPVLLRTEQVKNKKELRRNREVPPCQEPLYLVPTPHWKSGRYLILHGRDAGDCGLYRGGGYASHGKSCSTIWESKAYGELLPAQHRYQRRGGAGAAPGWRENCALVTDAGDAGGQRPGEDLVAQCAAAGVPVVAIPRAKCALDTALAVSGLPTDALPQRDFWPTKKNRRAHLKELKSEQRTMIFFMRRLTNSRPRSGTCGGIPGGTADLPLCAGAEQAP